MVIAHPLILTGYGHWLPNDPRGSLSVELRKEELSELGDIHYGRKSPQPPREEIREFFRKAPDHLDQPILWFEEAQRAVIAEAFREEIVAQGLTCYACAILPNHAHLVIRVHKLKGREMIDRFKFCSRSKLIFGGQFPQDHRVWSEDVADIYKFSPDQVTSAIDYTNGNPAKHRLPPQTWGFVVPYDGWPFHKRRARQ